MHVVQLPVVYIDEAGTAALQVEQRVPLHVCLMVWPKRGDARAIGVDPIDRPMTFDVIFSEVPTPRATAPLAPFSIHPPSSPCATAHALTRLEPLRSPFSP